METIIKTKTDASLIFKDLQKQLQGELSFTHGEYKLVAQSDSLNAVIYGMRVNTNKVFLEFDIKTSEDITINLASLDLNPIHFLYCHQNQLVQTFESGSEKHQVEEFQTVIMHDKKRRAQRVVKAGSHIKASLALLFLSCIITV